MIILNEYFGREYLRTAIPAERERKVREMAARDDVTKAVNTKYKAELTRQHVLASIAEEDTWDGIASGELSLPDESSADSFAARQEAELKKKAKPEKKNP